MVAAALPQSDLSLGPLFFYGSYSPLSNHYRCGFTVKNIYFPHMESFLMYCKAMLCGDHSTAKQILAEADPVACKRLGRLVRPYLHEVWVAHNEEYAYMGNLAKFGQNEYELAYLMASGERELVEASQSDSLWGIGMSANDPRIAQRELWGGNKHGRVLMRTRQYFKERSYERPLSQTGAAST